MELGQKFKSAGTAVKGLGTAAVVGIGSLVATPDAEAVVVGITQDFTVSQGSISGGALFDDIIVGTKGFFGVNSDTSLSTDLDPSAAVGSYDNTITTVFMYFETGQTFYTDAVTATGLDNNILIANNFSGSRDAFGIFFRQDINELSGSDVVFKGYEAFITGIGVTDTTTIAGGANDFANHTGPLNATDLTFNFNNLAGTEPQSLNLNVTNIDAVVPEPSALPFQITEFDYDKAADTLTFVWNSRPDTSYSIVYTEDLATEFSNVLIASVPSAGASTSYGPVASPVPGADQLFFKVVENE